METECGNAESWNGFTCLGKFYQLGNAGAKKYKNVCSKYC